jgi:levanbiose-producing levanase
VANSLAPVNGVVQLEILVDRGSLEIFGNGGLLYMPMPVTSPASTSLVSLTCADGSATFNSLVVSKLDAAWPQP